MNKAIIMAAIILGLLRVDRPLATGAASAVATEHPLIVAPDQGQVRVWRPLVSESPAEQKFDQLSRFIIKVDREEGGSPDFWFGTETLPPGAGIPFHRHLHQDEVVYIISGTAYVHVGSLKGEARRGTIVFIPRDTWVSFQSAGKSPISLLFAFNAPGFDRYMRCESVPLGHRAWPVTAEEDRRCTKEGEVEYR